MSDELLHAVRDLTTAVHALRRSIDDAARPAVKLPQAASDWSVSTETMRKLAAILADDNTPISFQVGDGHPLFSRRAMAAVEARLCNLPEPQRINAWR